MRVLDQAMADELWRLWIEVGNGEKVPYAVKRETSLVVTNNQFMVDWPHELVDYMSKRVKQLISTAKIYETARQFELTPWIKLVAPNKRCYYDAEEVEPRDDELGFIVYEFRTPRGVKRAKYDSNFHQILTNACSMQPSFKVYHTGGDLAMLLVFEADHKVGGIANVVSS